jgi:hypothetical protein
MRLCAFRISSTHSPPHSPPLPPQEAGLTQRRRSAQVCRSAAGLACRGDSTASRRQDAFMPRAEAYVSMRAQSMHAPRRARTRGGHAAQRCDVVETLRKPCPLPLTSEGPTLEGRCGAFDGSMQLSWFECLAEQVEQGAAGARFRYTRACPAVSCAMRTPRAAWPLSDVARPKADARACAGRSRPQCAKRTTLHARSAACFSPPPRPLPPARPSSSCARKPTRSLRSASAADCPACTH